MRNPETVLPTCAAKFSFQYEGLRNNDLNAPPRPDDENIVQGNRGIRPARTQQRIRVEVNGVEIRRILF